jgi:alpha-tubulin suppressor-like RCC1 family protein
VPVRVTAGPSGQDGPYDYIHTGTDSTCAGTPAGEAYCWGANDSGQLGDGTTRDSASPVRVEGDNSYSSIRVGRGSVCAETTSGSVRCWGANDSGQLGNGTTTDASVPVPVGQPEGSGPITAAQVSAGAATMCALADDGDVWCWGSDEFGLLGNGTD